MLKKIAVLAVTAMLALSFPCVAFADEYVPSPGSNAMDPVTGDNGTILYPKPALPEDKENLDIEPAPLPDGDLPGNPKDAFDISTKDGTDLDGDLDLTFDVGRDNGGKKVHILYSGDGGETFEEIASGTADLDGKFTITTNLTGLFVVTIEEGSTGPVIDSSATSPSTGAHSTVALFALGSALAVATAVTIIARKRLEK